MIFFHFLMQGIITVNHWEICKYLMNIKQINLQIALIFKTAFQHTGCLLLSLLFVSNVLATDLADDREIEQKEGELRDLQSQISEIETGLGSSEQHRQALIAKLQTTEQQIGQSARKLRILEGSLQRQRQQLVALQENRQRQQLELEAQREGLVRQLRAAYAMGRQEQLKILLNQQDPVLVSRVMVYYDYFNRARTERMSRIEAGLEALRDTQRKIAKESRRFTTLLAQEQEEQRRLENVSQTRQQVIAALESEILGKGDELQGLKRDEQKLANLVKRLQEELIALPETARHKPFKQLKGKLKWPASGRLSSRFGARKTAGLKWDGVIISAPEGLEVRAVHHGRVAFADWLRGLGLLLIIDHGDGYMTLYGHNQSLFKETGEWVEPGEAVALVGSSGGRSSTGVYFGIRYNGRPVNPKSWCLKTKGKKVG